MLLLLGTFYVIHLVITNIRGSYAALNFNIAWLCTTQGLSITMSNISNTLLLLAMLCEAPDLGTSHPFHYYDHHSLLFDLEEVVAVHMEEAAKPWEVVDYETENLNVQDELDEHNVQDELDEHNVEAWEFAQ